VKRRWGTGVLGGNGKSGDKKKTNAHPTTGQLSCWPRGIRADRIERKRCRYLRDTGTMSIDGGGGNKVGKTSKGKNILST